MHKNEDRTARERGFWFNLGVIIAHVLIFLGAFKLWDITKFVYEWFAL